jgi:hypothetical protein
MNSYSISIHGLPSVLLILCSYRDCRQHVPYVLSYMQTKFSKVSVVVNFSVFRKLFTTSAFKLC